MGVIELIVVAIGLAMDAFAISLGKGLTARHVALRHALTAGAWFGGFQALMPLVGYALGYSFTEVVANIDHWIAFGLLLLIGLNMIREALWGDDEAQDADFGFRVMFVMAVATSIDALAIGVTMAFLNVNILLAATVIGVVTFALSVVGVYLGSHIGDKLGSRVGVLGGVILIALGVKILIEHLSTT